MQEHLGSHPGKVVWLEDGIGDEAKKWVAAKKNFLYLETWAFEGVNRKHIIQMAKFADVKRPGTTR